MDEDQLQRARGAWRHRGRKRPDGAVEPGPGQESVWDYPRPPAVVEDSRPVQVWMAGVLVAHSQAAKRVLETASPPVFYLPPEAVRRDLLRPESRTTFCEWKGRARYLRVCVADHCVEHAAWCYPEPLAGYEAITDYVAFYPGRVECYVDGQRVRSQQGGFYGGWVTDEIVGPYKGEPGTLDW